MQGRTVELRRRAARMPAEQPPADPWVDGARPRPPTRPPPTSLRPRPPARPPAETKRSEFPRFYFVSDPTLLEILSLGSDPPAVVPHFQSGLFDSLSNVTFDKVRPAGGAGAGGGAVAAGGWAPWLPGRRGLARGRLPASQRARRAGSPAAPHAPGIAPRGARPPAARQADRTKMLEMFSREGECVPFEAPVEAKGNIEVWLQRLVEGMQVRGGAGGSRRGRVAHCERACHAGSRLAMQAAGQRVPVPPATPAR